MASPLLPTDSKQLRILKKLCNHLELTSGYEGIKVFRGKTVVSAQEIEDCLSILEAPRPVVGEAAGHLGHKRNESWTLLLQGWPKDDKKNPSDPAYNLRAAVEKWLSRITEVDERSGLAKYPDLYLLGGDIGSMIVGQGVVRPPSEDAASRLAMFYLPLILEITTDIRNPSGK
jgi:hypothetical protein